MRKLVLGAAAAVTVLLSATVYLFQQDDIVKENVEVHQAIANILPGRGVPVFYLDDDKQIALNADTLDIEGTRGIEAVSYTHLVTLSVWGVFIVGNANTAYHIGLAVSSSVRRYGVTPFGAFSLNVCCPCWCVNIGKVWVTRVASGTTGSTCCSPSLNSEEKATIRHPSKSMFFGAVNSKLMV